MNPKRNGIQTDSKSLKQQHLSDLFNKRHSNWSNSHLSTFHQLTKEDEDIQMANSTLNVISLQEQFQSLISNSFNDKSEVVKTLKAIRKELANSKITNDIQLVLSNATQIVFVLSGLLCDFKNSEIQLEVIWILTIISAYCSENHFNLSFTSIHNRLIDFLSQEKKFSNQGIKNLILEKFFCLVSNLVFTDEATLDYYLGNCLLNCLFVNLNSTVRSFRNVCLWLLSKIFSKIAFNNKYQLYLNKYFDKDALFYYKFILSRIEMKKSIDEMYEFYWLINDLTTIQPDILTVLFLNDTDKGIVKKIHSVILEMALVSKLIQPCVRLLSNLIVVGHNDMIRRNIIYSIVNYQPLMSYLNELIMHIDKYDIEIVKDSMVLLFNVSCYEPNCLIRLFYPGIATLVYNQIGMLDNSLDNDCVAKLTMNIYYKMQLHLLESKWEVNEEMRVSSWKIVQCVVMNYKVFAYNEVLMLIAIDLILIHIQMCLKIEMTNHKVHKAVGELNLEISLRGGHITSNYYEEIIKALITFLNG